MPLKIYNTYTRKKEIFKPIEKGKVGMYVCGPTIYDYVHIGNLRAYVVADVLRRYLKFNKYKVKEVMNLTDVDDKTIKKSQEQHKNLKEFTKKYEEAFYEDIKAMNIDKPDVVPKATEHIKEMVAIIKKLLKKGIAYKTEDGIYFSINKFKDYGKLSGVKIKELKAGASERVSKDEYDKEPPMIKKEADGSYTISGKASIREVNDELDIALPMDQVTTINGLLLLLFEKVPKQGEHVRIKGIGFKVLEVKNNMVLKARVTLSSIA